MENRSLTEQFKKREKEQQRKYLAVSVTSMLLFLIIWEVCSDGLRLLPVYSLPSPVASAEAFFRKFYDRSPDRAYIWQHALASLKVVLIGGGLGVAVGIPLGILMGWYTRFDLFFKGIFDVIRPIPPIAWIPLVILWFGVGELPKYAIIFIGSFTNITLNAYTGAQRVDPTLIGCARMLGTSDRDIFLRVILPSSLPQIFAGMQVALSTAWMAVLAAEMVGAQEGCGWIILRGSDTTNIPWCLWGWL